MERRILIAEDSKHTSEQLRMLLQADDQLTVDTVADGQAALQALAQHSYSILLTDLQMPHLDGMQLIERIQEKQFPSHRHRDDRLRQHRSGGQGHAHGCVRFPGQAGGSRTPAAGDRARAAGADVAGRGDPVARADAQAIRFRQRPQRESEDACSLRDDPQRGPDDDDRADRGRDGHRQGAGGAGDPRRRRRPRAFRRVRGHQLRRPAGDAAGERAVRPRERLVHRGDRPAQGALRAGRRRHAVSRRGRRHAAAACRPSCCACCRSAASSASAARQPSRWTSASSPPRTAGCRSWCGRANSARICITG